VVGEEEESPGNPWKCAGGDRNIIRFQVSRIRLPANFDDRQFKVFDSSDSSA